MQNQGTERIASTSKKESSVYTEAHTTTSEQDKLLNIDFGNVEDMLDFSKPHVPTSTLIKSPMHQCEPCIP